MERREVAISMDKYIPTVRKGGWEAHTCRITCGKGGMKGCLGNL